MYKSIRILFILLLSATILPAWAADEAETQTKAIYYQFPAKPAIRIDFSRQSQQKMNLLQVEVALMAYDQEILDVAKSNLPMLKHDLRRLLAKQTLEGVNTVKGRESLQKAALKMINTNLKEESGQDGIHDIFFTSFILQ